MPPTTQPATTRPVIIQPEQLQEAVTNNINNLIESSSSNTNTVLDNIVSLTSGQQTSIAIPMPENLTNIFTANPTTYPLLNNSTVPLILATTTTDPITNIEILDTNIIPSNTTIVVPSLIAAATLKMGESYIIRNNSNQIALTNKFAKYDTITGLLIFSDLPCSTCPSPTSSITGVVTYSDPNCTDCNYQWSEVGSKITIDNKLYQLSGIGSPVLFTPIENIPIVNIPLSSESYTILIVFIIIILVLICGLIYYFNFVNVATNTSDTSLIDIGE